MAVVWPPLDCGRNLDRRAQPPNYVPSKDRRAVNPFDRCTEVCPEAQAFAWGINCLLEANPAVGNVHFAFSPIPDFR